jgi:hypothetical protein
MATLYEITREVSDILARLLDAEERAEGEVTDEVMALEKEWLAVQGDRKDKLGAYLAVADEQDGKAERDKERAAYLKQRAERHEAKAERLRKAVQLDMEANKETKIEAGDYTAAIKPGRDRVDIGMEFLPWAEKTERKDLLRIKPAEPDKVAIKAAIKAGQIVTGAKLVKGDPSLSIPRAKKDKEASDGE